MEEEKEKPYEERNMNEVYIPYWVHKFQQIIDEVRGEKRQKYNKKSF